MPDTLSQRYVLTSESNQTGVWFEDIRSGRKFAGMIASGRAALLVVGIDGKLLASYNWSNLRVSATVF